jgi:hypothetical protein
VVLQQLSAWRPKAPKLRGSQPTEGSAEPAPFIDGGPEVGEGRQLSDFEQYQAKIRAMEAAEEAQAAAGGRA